MKSNQLLRPLFDKLVLYSKSNVVPFDVPGHKMGVGIHPDFTNFVGNNIFKLDINSLKELDNLSNPVGVIKEAEQLAADFFKSDNAFFIVNGSTAGVQNMILSACNPGDKLILPRNIHKSAINGLVLSGVTPVYIETLIDDNVGISIGVSIEETIKTIDENKDAKAILLLNPTYHGFVIDLKTIIDYAHSKGIIVLIDESHGTHFYLDDLFGTPSMSLGADMATISVHKTGGSLTQSSILLHNDGLVSKYKVRSVINLMQTSSASYLLMGSLDMARHHLATTDGLSNKIIELSNIVKTELADLDNIKLITNSISYNNETYFHDMSKILIDVTKLGKTGYEIYDILKKDYNIQIELGETLVILAIISVGDTIESVTSLINAIKDLSKRFHGDLHTDLSNYKLLKPIIKINPREAFFMETEYVTLMESIDRIAGDQIMVYPPGIPLVVGGEVITKQIIEKYTKLIEYGNQVVGTINNGEIKIKVLKEKV